MTDLDADNETGSLAALAARYGVRRTGREAPTETHRRTTALQAQMARGFVRLRFETTLEPDFRRYLRRTARHSRLAMLAVGLAAVTGTPALNGLWMPMPAALANVLDLIDGGFMAPMLLVTGVIVIRYNDSPAADWALLTLMFAMSGGVFAERLVSARYGVDLPVELAIAPLLAVVLLGRVPFPRVLVAAVLVLSGVSVAEALWFSPQVFHRFHLYAVTVLVVVALCAGYSSEYFIRWSWLNSRLLRYMARCDALTGLLNRPAVEDAVERFHARAGRDGGVYALVLIDVDRFGAYNNCFGHPAGDAVLREMGGVLAEQARPPDEFCGRYGGEEFLAVWSVADGTEAARRADAVRRAVTDCAIPAAPAAEYDVVTASIGVCVVSTAERLSIAPIIERADQALYAAKNGGRNGYRLTEMAGQ